MTRGIKAYGAASVFDPDPCIACFLPAGVPTSHGLRPASSDTPDTDPRVLSRIRKLLWEALTPLPIVLQGGAGRIGSLIADGELIFWFSSPPGPAACAVAGHLVRQLQTKSWQSASSLRIPLCALNAWRKELGAWKTLAPLLTAAATRNIPVGLAWHGDGPVASFGMGPAQQSLFGPHWSGDSAAVARLCDDKLTTRSFLLAMKVPIPPGGAVRSLREATDLAATLGYPAVLKAPMSSNSCGVVARIPTPERLAAAYRHLRRRYRTGPFVLERMLSGQYVRALVVDGACLRVSSGTPCTAVGDGSSSVAQIVTATCPAMMSNAEQINRLENLLLPQGLSLESIPEPGHRIVVSPDTASWQDCSADLHPDNRNILETVGRRLSPARLGIDIKCRDVQIPWEQPCDGIIEINSGPGTWFHADQGGLAATMLSRAIPTGNGRIPVVAFVGAEASEFASRAAAFCAAAGLVGATATQHVGDPLTQIVIACLELEAVLDDGLPFDWCDVAILGSDAPGPLRDCLLRSLKQGGQLVIQTIAELDPATAGVLRRRGIRIVEAQNDIAGSVEKVMRCVWKRHRENLAGLPAPPPGRPEAATET